MINQEKKIYGLIGYPVEHSLSPLMHNAAFRALKIDAEYKLFPLLKEGLADFFKNILKERIFGLNVTIPYKEIVIPFLDKLSEETGLIGAVNTIKVLKSGLKGFNTDGAGFLQHLNHLKFSPKDKTIAIIGAGGAAKAACVYLAKARVRSIHIYDIDHAKAKALVANLEKKFKNIEFRKADSIGGLNIKECNLLVNATPIGMRSTDPCLVEGRFLRPGLLVYDLIYNPYETKLLISAKKAGAKVSNGLGMLLYQGAESFRIWTGREAPIEVMRQALKFKHRSSFMVVEAGLEA